MAERTSSGAGSTGPPRGAASGGGDAAVGAAVEARRAISRSLRPLREVVASLSAAGAGAMPRASDRRKLARRVRAAGSSVLPALLRALCSDRPAEAQWAGWLLQRVSPPERPRVVERLARVLEDPRLREPPRQRVVALLRALMPRVAGDEDEGEADADLEVDPQVQEGREDQREAPVSRHGDLRLGPALDEDTLPGEARLPERDLRLLRALDAQPASPTRPTPPAATVEGMTPSPAGATAGLPIQSEEPAPPAVGRINRRRDHRRSGVDLLERGELSRARAALARAVATDPDDTEALSYLGVCLLQLGHPEQALVYLERACTLEPDEALHHWNVAAAARASERACRGYLALQRYLALDDQYQGAEHRRREARRLLEHGAEHIARMHPGVALPDVLRGEQLFLRAFNDLSARRFEAAARGFREVVRLLPHHYPSWGNLGAAEVALGNSAAARRCLERALRLKPDYPVAKKNLRLLDPV